jgi:hypothetical protein
MPIQKLSFRIEPEFVERIDELAGEQSCSRSKMIEILIREGLGAFFPFAEGVKNIGEAPPLDPPLDALPDE